MSPSFYTFHPSTQSFWVTSYSKVKVKLYRIFGLNCWYNSQLSHWPGPGPNCRSRGDPGLRSISDNVAGCHWVSLGVASWVFSCFVLISGPWPEHRDLIKQRMSTLTNCHQRERKIKIFISEFWVWDVLGKGKYDLIFIKTIFIACAMFLLSICECKCCNKFSGVTNQERVK